MFVWDVDILTNFHWGISYLITHLTEPIRISSTMISAYGPGYLGRRPNLPVSRYNPRESDMFGFGTVAVPTTRAIHQGVPWRRALWASERVSPGNPARAEYWSSSWRPPRVPRVDIRKWRNISMGSLNKSVVIGPHFSGKCLWSRYKGVVGEPKASLWLVDSRNIKLTASTACNAIPPTNLAICVKPVFWYHHISMAQNIGG